ncbi:MAG: GNAT family N-acetyltransferase [Candidatus Acidiferrales bacterium]
MASEPAKVGQVKNPEVVVRPLELKHLAAADQVFRLAFGTFLGLPDPAQFNGDADFVRSRWRADPKAVFAAEIDGELVGSNFATNWGSFGFFGPLTVRPDLWDRGIAKRLLEPTMALFETWGTKHRGLFTFAHSPKHVGLYQKFGFWPRHLTPVMQRPVSPDTKTPHAKTRGWSKLSDVASRDRTSSVAACKEVTDEIFAGLNVEREILAVVDQGLGDVVLLEGNGKLAGFAVCHCGVGSEAGSGTCYIKFGAVRPGRRAADDFDRLLDACAVLAAERKAARVLAGVNAGRAEAYRQMLERGFRTEYQGVAMETGSPGSGYNHPGVFVIDDWR